MSTICRHLIYKQMEFYLKLSYLNDFGFCPLSIYYRQLYGSLSERCLSERLYNAVDKL